MPQQLTSAGRLVLGPGWVLGTIVRVLVFIALDGVGVAWAGWDAARANPDGGVNIFLGLVVFAAEIVVAFVWGAFDAWRGLRFAPLVIRWAVVGLLIGCFASVYIQAGSGPINLAVLLSDLVAVGLFEAALIVGTAIAGAAILLASGRGGGAFPASSPQTS